jgi:branched-chain amino acid transport system permease protein
VNQFFTVYRPEIGHAGIAALYALSLYIVLAAGQLSLAQAAFGAIASYTSVLLTMHLHLPFLVVILAGIAASTVAAGLLAFPVRRLRGVFLAIATIAFGEMIRILIVNLDFTGGANGIVGIPPKTQLWHIYLALAIAGFLLARLAPSRFGRQLAALREDELAAALQGINVGRVRVMAFLVSGALAGLAGALDAHFSYIIEPQTYGSGLAIQILTWGIVGGSTVWFGPPIGGALLVLLPTFLQDIGVQAGWITLLLQGIILLLVILFLPDGLGQLVPQRRRRPPKPQRQPSGHKPLSLTVENVSLSFGGVQALRDVSISVRSGEVLGLVGPNGAGKTTLINAVTGVRSADSGRVLIGDTDVTRMRAHRIAQLGVSRTFQNLRIFKHFTALDNVIAGATRIMPGTYLGRLLWLPKARRIESRHAAWAAALLQDVGLGDKAMRRASTLSYGDQRRLEIARALAAGPGVVILDEPAAGMNHTEALRLVDVIRAIAAAGRCVVLIEHNMVLVMAASDRVCVLNFGEVVSVGTPDEVGADTSVQEAYLGA